MKSTFWIRSVQRENFHGPEINHSLLQLEQHQGTCGFPEEWPIPKGLLGLLRKPEISSPMVHGPLNLLPGRGAGLPQGLLDEMDPQQSRESETPTGNFLGFSWQPDVFWFQSCVKMESKTRMGDSVIFWWPAPLCSLMCGTQLTSPDWSCSLVCGSQGLMGHWCSEQANILSFIFSSHSTL